jgi:hypothetical protein
MEAYNRNVTVKMNELNALLQKVTEQVQAFDRIVAESASDRVQRGHTEASDSLARDGKATLYLGFYNKQQDKRSWCEDGHPDEERFRKNGWNPATHSQSKDTILNWVQKYNEDRPSSTAPKENDIPDEIITEKRNNGTDVKSVDPDGNHSEDLGTGNPYLRKTTQQIRSKDEERRWMADDERPPSFWERNRWNLKEQFEREVDQYGSPTRDHHTKRAPVTPNTAERRRQMASEYLMGYGGVKELLMADLESLHFYDPQVTIQLIRPMHKQVIASWQIQTHYGTSIGPDHSRIIDKIDAFPVLHSTKQRDVLTWLKQLPNLLASYKILLMPFDHIELRFGPVGLCMPGVGTEKYSLMGSAWAMILEKIISNTIDRKILSLLSIVRNKVPSNGYNILHKLLVETVACFDPNSIMTEYPHYSDYEDIYTFAEDFDSFVAMKKRKGETVTAKAASMSFLDMVMRGVGDRMHTGAYLLRQELMEYQDGEEIPDKFDISMMASTIATSAPRQDDYDVDRHRTERRIHKTEEQEDARQALDQLAINEDLGVKLNQHIQGYSQTIYQCNSVSTTTWAKKFQTPHTGSIETAAMEV